jgi:hypothetical protein
MREPTNQSLSKRVCIFAKKCKVRKDALTTAKECIYHQETATWKERCSNDQRLLPFFARKSKAAYTAATTPHTTSPAPKSRIEPTTYVFSASFPHGVSLRILDDVVQKKIRGKRKRIPFACRASSCPCFSAHSNCLLSPLDVSVHKALNEIVREDM